MATSSPIPPEREAADKAKAAADTAADQVAGVRERIRRVTDTEDMKRVRSEAAPFLRGVAFVGALTVDAPLTVGYGVYRAGRFAQKVRAERKARESQSATE